MTLPRLGLSQLAMHHVVLGLIWKVFFTIITAQKVILNQINV